MGVAACGVGEGERRDEGGEWERRKRKGRRKRGEGEEGEVQPAGGSVNAAQRPAGQRDSPAAQPPLTPPTGTQTGVKGQGSTSQTTDLSCPGHLEANT